MIILNNNIENDNLKVGSDMEHVKEEILEEGTQKYSAFSCVVICYL